MMKAVFLLVLFAMIAAAFGKRSVYLHACFMKWCFIFLKLFTGMTFVKSSPKVVRQKEIAPIHL